MTEFWRIIVLFGFGYFASELLHKYFELSHAMTLLMLIVLLPIPILIVEPRVRKPLLEWISKKFKTKDKE